MFLYHSIYKLGDSTVNCPPKMGNHSKSTFASGCVIFLAGISVGILFSTFIAHHNSLTIKCTVHSLASLQQNLELEWKRVNQRVRLLCAVVTWPGGKTNAEAVKATWGKRCDKLLFMSTASDPELPATVVLPNLNGTKKIHLWRRHMATFKYIYEKHLNDYDWFLKADDNTFMVIDNLKLLLKDQNTKNPVYFGSRYINGKFDYLTGGAGYVLSREAVRRYVEKGILESLCTHKDTPDDDVEMGICMNTLDVQKGETRDQYNRHRFLQLPPEKVMIPGGNTHAHVFAYPLKEGLDCCSNTIISFHDIKLPAKIYAMEFLLYRARPFGAYFQNMSRAIEYLQSPIPLALRN